MSKILSVTAIELAEKLKSGEISCVDACKEYIGRIDKFEKERGIEFFEPRIRSSR